LAASAKLLNAVGFLPDKKKEKAAGIVFSGTAAARWYILPSERTAAHLKEEAVAVSERFTPIPKTYELMQAGVPPQVVATYAALSDYANNQTGECWPRMETLARTLGRTPRTIQSHLHLLKDLGLIEFVERRRDEKGRFLSWLYRIPHVAQAAQRIKERREKNRAAYQERKRREREEREQKRREKRLSKTPSTGNPSPVASNRLTNNTNNSPPNPPKGAFNWLFGKERNLEAEAEYKNQQQEQRNLDSVRRRDGFGWLLD